MVDEAAFRSYFAVIRLRIRRTRNAIGLSQEDAAGRVSLDARALQRYEARVSDVEDPRLKTLYRIAAALEMPLSDLLRPPTKEELRALEEWE